jgi:hypothetical protein
MKKQGIILGIIFAVIVAVASFYNSEWITCQWIKTTKAQGVKLQNGVEYDYIPKYEDGLLKVKLIIRGIDENMLAVGRNIAKYEYAIRLDYLDKDNFRVATVDIFPTDFIKSGEKEHIVMGTTKISKKELRRCKGYIPITKKYLTMTYKQYLAELFKI